MNSGKFRAVWTRIARLAFRHRLALRDLALLVAVMAVLAYIGFSIDVFENAPGASPHEQVIELDEVLLLGVLLAIGLLLFAIRRWQAQRRETTRRIAAEREARELAYQDGLTGLANRRQFDEALKLAIASPPGADAAHALMLLDLNGFKQINDVHGHGAGDEVLVMVAQRLSMAMRDGDLVARFGGDEFAVLARHIAGAEAATGIAQRICEAFARPIAAGDHLHSVGTGIGIAMIPHDSTDAVDALRKADVALYRAKAERRSAFRFFEPAMDRRVRERDQLERAFRAALEGGRVTALYRPSVDLRTGEISAFDISARWLDPALGAIPQARFLPIAEDAGLSHALGQRLLEEACRAAQHWPQRVGFSLALSQLQLRDPGLSERIEMALANAMIAPQRLELEISEATLVADLDQAREALSHLRSLGVSIAVGGFGTGYSNLYHLRNFKLDKIKIDRSFLAGLSERSEDAQILGALVGLGHGLGVRVAVEGVAAPEQQLALLATGCNEAQGALFGDPLSAEETFARFAAGRGPIKPSAATA